MTNRRRNRNLAAKGTRRNRSENERKISRNVADTDGFRSFLEVMRKAAQEKHHDWRSDPDFQALERAVAIFEIEDLENLYAATDNPLCAWYAFRTARQNGLLVPSWIRRYLDRAAENLTQDEKPKGDAHIAIAAAIGMRTDSRGNIFTQFQENRMRFRTVCEMVRRKRDPTPMTRRERAEYAAACFYPENPPSHWTVEKWHDRMNRFVGRFTAEIKRYQAQLGRRTRSVS